MGRAAPFVKKYLNSPRYELIFCARYEIRPWAIMISPPPHEKSGPYFDSNTIYMKIRARSVGEFPSLCRGGGGSRFRNAMGRKTVVVHNGDGSIWLVFRAIKESIMKNFHHVLVMGMCELTRFRWVFCDRFFIFIYLRMT